MKEKPINYDNLPLGSVWDGSPIRRTLNCNGCLYLVKVKREKEAMEICAWGVAWKVLEKVERQHKCIKVDKKPPERSVLSRISRIS